MVQLSTEERALVDELLECIAEAMTRLDDIDPAYANRTKLQKLLYLAVDEYDLPLTYSWYLAGAVIPDDAATSSDLQTAFDDLPGTETPGIPSAEETAPDGQDLAADAETDEPASGAGEPAPDATVADSSAPASSPEEFVGADEGEPDSETASPDTTVDPVLFSDASPSGGDDEPATSRVGDRRDEIVDFYEEAIPEVWHQKTMRFLQNFYLDHAPAAYRDLYVQSTHFRTRLDDIEGIVTDHAAGEEPTLSLEEEIDSAGLDISDMHYTIRSSDDLSGTFDAFVRGTDVIEDGLMMLAQSSPESLDHEHVAAVQSMQEFFYYYVWRYPCLIISRETATGPQAEALRDQRQRRLDTFERELERERDAVRRELEAAGLWPDYTDYETPDDEMETKIRQLADNYLE